MSSDEEPGSGPTQMASQMMREAGSDDAEESAEPVEDLVAARMFSELKLAARMGRFTLLSEVGHGGMGTVYAAHDPRLDRKVAIKIVRTSATSDISPSRARLQREARALARLAHPNVVQVYEVGQHEGQLFVAMEFIEGQDLRDWISQERRSWREVLDVLLHAGRGLAAAHEAGLIHRDFKPDNVLMGSDGRVCVADFGLVRTEDARVGLEAPPEPGARAGVDLSDDTFIDPKRPLTRAGALLGTPVYMSPEQFAGTPPGVHTDQYSFCVSLYEALYGRLPVRASTFQELASRVVAGDLDEPPEDSRVPAWVRRVVMRGLEVAPADRWPSMNALLGELSYDPDQGRVVCGDCGTANHRGRQYCAGCGAGLSIICRACGELEVPQSRFCGACGATLGAASLAEGAESGSPWASELSAERRHAAILRIELDTAGAVDDTGAPDPELEHRMVRRLTTVVEAMSQRMGGFLQRLDRSLLVSFGAPYAHGNDAERGARMALALAQEVGATEGSEALPLRISMGLAYGDVVVSTRRGLAGHDLTVTGPPLGGALALANSAQPGQVLVDRGVVENLGGALYCLPTGEPGRWALQASGRESGEAPPESRVPLVGRRVPLERFDSALAGLGEGQGALFHVRGEAGIGKTRLLDAFIEVARQRSMSAHRGLTLDFGVSQGEGCIAALACGLLGVPADGDADARVAAIARAEGRGLIGEAEQASLFGLLALPLPERLRQLYEAMDDDTRSRWRREALARLIRAACAERPQLLIVEDVHWANAETLGDLGAIAASIASQPAVLVTSTRTAEDPFIDRVEASWNVIELGPLRREEALDLARMRDAIEPEVAERCLERAGGNPMFLEQLLRAAEQGEQLVPSSVQAVVLARFDRMSAADRRAIKAATVLGQRFSLESLRHVAGDPSLTLDGPRDARMVRPEGRLFMFDHALIRDGVYASMLQDQRRGFHARAADWYATRERSLWAEHLGRAGDPEAATACLEVADELRAAFSYERALELVGHGLSTAQADQRHRLLCLRGRVEQERGKPSASLSSYDEAIAQASGDEEHGRAWMGRALALRSTNQTGDAIEAVDRAESHILRTSSGSPSRVTLGRLARCHSLRGNLHFQRGQIAACRKEHEQALALALDAGDAEAEAQALGGLGDASYAVGRWVTAGREMSRCVERCKELGDVRTIVAYVGLLRHTEGGVRPTGTLIEELESNERLSERVGHDRARLVTLTSIAGFLRAQGRWAELVEVTARGMVLAEQFGIRPLHTMLVTERVMGEAMAGKRGLALRRLRRMIDDFDDVDRMFAGPNAYGTLARLVPGDEERDAAILTGQRLLPRALAHNLYYFGRDAIDSMLETSRWDAALRYSDALDSWAPEGENPFCAYIAARGRAVARHEKGERSDALASELVRLRDDGRRLELDESVPALERACEVLGLGG